MYILDDLITSRHTHADIGIPAGLSGVPVCALCWVLFPPAPLPKTADGHGPPCSGVPLFFLSRRPGEDGQDVTLSQAGESLPLDERVLRFGGCKAR